MLLRYIVSNYKSIGHNIEFSMLPASEDIDDRFVTTISTKMGDWKVLRRGGLFGPNASGKSSFIQSVQYAKSMIVDGRKSGGTTGVNPFRGNLKSIGDQSTFQFVIYADGDVYEYGFSVTRSRVSEEWLSILTENNMQEIFQRTTDIEGYTDIKVNDEFYDKENASLISILINSMKKEQKNQLFLYKLFDNAIDVAKPLVNWFNEIQLIYPNTKVKGLPLAIKSNKDFRKYTEKGYKTKIENYRDWFLNPASDFNTFYKGVCTNEALLNGKEILNRLDMMVEDTEQFPENTFNFVAAVHP